MTGQSTTRALALLAGLALSMPASMALAQSTDGTAGASQSEQAPAAAAPSEAAPAGTTPGAQPKTGLGCEEQIGMLDSFIKQSGQSAQEAEKKARELAASEPLLVLMADGRVINLSGEEQLSQPLESWTNALDAEERAAADLRTARELHGTSKEEDCVKLLEPYKFTVPG